MQRTVESNRTLLIDGPASVKVVSGRTEVFGCQIKPSQQVLVREGRRLPFFVVENTLFEVSQGANACVTEADGSTIPPSWAEPIESILRVQKKPVVIMVLGKSDSGKSSYCTYLVNKLLDGKCRVAVLDGDLGQSDIGPSGTVSYAVTSRQVAELYDLKLENAFFVGVTSPLSAFAKTVEGMAAMQTEILSKMVDYVVVNTDGWVTGDLAVNHKVDLVKELKPDVLVGVQAENELGELTSSLDQPVHLVEVSQSLSSRTAEKRKSLREMTYARYLKDAKLTCYPMNQLSVEPLNAVPKRQVPERGLLVGFYGSGTKFLGIGVLREINQERRTLKVQTAVSTKPHRIVIGKVFLDGKLREILD